METTQRIARDYVVRYERMPYMARVSVAHSAIDGDFYDLRCADLNETDALEIKASHVCRELDNVMLSLSKWVCLPYAPNLRKPDSVSHLSAHTAVSVMSAPSDDLEQTTELLRVESFGPGRIIVRYPRLDSFVVIDMRERFNKDSLADLTPLYDQFLLADATDESLTLEELRHFAGSHILHSDEHDQSSAMLCEIVDEALAEGKLKHPDDWVDRLGDSSEAERLRTVEDEYRAQRAASWSRVQANLGKMGF